MNISSVVVQAMSENIDNLVEIFKEADFCDYHLHDKARGKIILTIEGEDVEEEIEEVIKFRKVSLTGLWRCQEFGLDWTLIQGRSQF